jgi:hypothetical protein
MRGVLHGAMALYLTRYLNVPPARAVLREDAGFHTYQMLEAGVRQFTVWGNNDAGRNILIAVARYLAAHSPTGAADGRHRPPPDAGRRAPSGGWHVLTPWFGPRTFRRPHDKFARPSERFRLAN